MIQLRLWYNSLHRVWNESCVDYLWNKSREKVTESHTTGGFFEEIQEAGHVVYSQDKKL